MSDIQVYCEEHGGLVAVAGAARLCPGCDKPFKPQESRFQRCIRCKLDWKDGVPACKCNDNFETGYRCRRDGCKGAVGDEEILGSVLYCPYDYSPLPAPRAKTVLYTPERGRIFLIVSGALAIFLILALLLFFLWPEVRDGQPGSTNIKPPMQPIQKPVQPESKTASSGSASGRTSTPDTTAIQHPPAETAKLSPKSAEVHPEDRQGTPSRATSESSDANPGSKSQSEPKSETSVASATLPPKLPQDSGKHPTKTTQQSELESPPLQPPQPPVPAAVHSGVLHYQGPPVPYNGVVVFDHLPQARLKFNFDRQAWTLLIKPNPDGTKRVTMISQKQGYQTNCDLNWEIVE